MIDADEAGRQGEKYEEHDTKGRTKDHCSDRSPGHQSHAPRTDGEEQLPKHVDCSMTHVRRQF